MSTTPIAIRSADGEPVRGSAPEGRFAAFWNTEVAVTPLGSTVMDVVVVAARRTVDPLSTIEVEVSPATVVVGAGIVVVGVWIVVVVAGGAVVVVVGGIVVVVVVVVVLVVVGDGCVVVVAGSVVVVVVGTDVVVVVGAAVVDVDVVELVVVGLWPFGVQNCTLSIVGLSWLPAVCEWPEANPGSPESEKCPASFGGFSVLTTAPLPPLTTM